MGYIHIKGETDPVFVPEDKLSAARTAWQRWMDEKQDTIIDLIDGQTITASQIKKIAAQSAASIISVANPHDENLEVLNRNIEPLLTDGVLTFDGEMRFLQERGAIRYTGNGHGSSDYEVVVLDNIAYRYWCDVLERWKQWNNTKKLNAYRDADMEDSSGAELAD